MRRFYRYCFYRHWRRCRRWSADGAEHAAVGILSMYVGMIALTVLFLASLLSDRSWVEFSEGLLIVTYFALYGMHYLLLARESRVTAIANEFRNGASVGLVVGYWVYDIGVPVLAFGLLFSLLLADALGS